MQACSCLPRDASQFQSSTLFQETDREYIDRACETYENVVGIVQIAQQMMKVTCYNQRLELASAIYMPEGRFSGSSTQ